MAITLADAMVMIGADDSPVAGVFNRVKGQTQSFVGGLSSSIMKIGGAAVLGGITAVAGGVAAIGVAAFNLSNDVDEATKLLQTQLGLSADEAAVLGNTIKDVYANNLGQSIEDVGAAVGIVSTQMNQFGQLTSEELQASTERALAFRDAWGTDIAQSTGAANALMENFGLTSQEAFDFIQSGMANGLNNSGDFLETITEYSVQFRDGGATASEFFSIMDTGLQNGMLGTDKAADLFKEFRLRIQDGSSGTADALAELGMDVDDVLAGLNDGSLSVMDVFSDVSRSLRLGPADDVTKFNAGVALMGSQFEDLGETAVNALDPLAWSMQDIQETTGDLNAQYDTMGNTVEGFKRRFLVAFAPVGDQLRETAGTILNAALPYLEMLATWLSVNIPVALSFLQAFWTNTLSPLIDTFVTNVGGKAVPMLNTLRDWFQLALPVAIQIVSDYWNNYLLPIGTALWAMYQESIAPALSDLFDWLGTQVPLAIDAISTAWDTVLSPALTALKDFLVDTVIPAIGDLFEWLNTSIPAAAQVVADYWNETLKPALETVYNYINDNVLPVMSDIYDWLFTNIPTAISDAQTALENGWDAIKTAVDTAWAVIGPIFDSIKGFGQWLAENVFNIDFKIPEVPDWLIPGSPTPFEIGLRGIDDAMQTMRSGLDNTVGQFATGTAGYSYASNDQFNFNVANPSDAQLAASLIDRAKRNQVREFMNRG